MEMLIALVIMAGSMTLLFTGFTSAIRAKNILRGEKENILHLQRLRLRLANLFAGIIDVKTISGHGYYMRYQGQMDPDPQFRLEIEAILKIENNTLTLTCWPHEGGPRQEVLSTSISAIEFEFFDEKEGEFKPQFPSKRPFMMKAIINNNEEEFIPLFL